MKCSITIPKLWDLQLDGKKFSARHPSDMIIHRIIVPDTCNCTFGVDIDNKSQIDFKFTSFSNDNFFYQIMSLFILYEQK